MIHQKDEVADEVEDMFKRFLHADWPERFKYVPSMDELIQATAQCSWPLSARQIAANEMDMQLGSRSSIAMYCSTKQT
jgi:hypothetical protein